MASRSLGSIMLRTALRGQFAFGAFGFYFDSTSHNHGSSGALGSLPASA